MIRQCDIGDYQDDGAMAKLAESNGFAGYFKTSAKTNEGIEDAVKAAQKEVKKYGNRLYG